MRSFFNIELTAEKFAQIYTDEKLRNEVAFGYIGSEQQTAEARKELERAKAEIYEKHSCHLLFVGMGASYTSRYKGDPCNYRIRTEFTNRYGHRFFIEFGRNANGNGFHIDHAIDRDKEIELNRNHERQGEYYNYKQLESTRHKLKYTKANILKLVNKHFDCLFQKVVIDHYTIHTDDREIICQSPK